MPNMMPGRPGLPKPPVPTPPGGMQLPKKMPSVPGGLKEKQMPGKKGMPMPKNKQMPSMPANRKKFALARRLGG